MVLLIYGLTTVLMIWLIQPKLHPVTYVISEALATGLLILVVWRTGEPLS